MSNWAKLQEDLIGKPVFKRAKHGIHFQNNDGSITANFSGKPCHFQDSGIWKPIDTKLVLLPDGFYGCPHSKVKVHPDGRVKVEGYQQRAELPSAKVGKADNDKLIREFSFGSQELRITEDGFRSEITLNRIPTLKEARKLIASESGTLSKKYLKSLTTATDANGDVHVVTTLTAFRTWLASAVFPVTIDPDFTTNEAGAGDTVLSSINKTRNYGARADTYNTTYSNPMVRFLLRFILTSITSGSTCTGASLYLVKVDGSGTNQPGTWNIYSIASGNSAWIEGTNNNSTAGAGEPCWDALAADGSGGVTTAWAGSAGMLTAGTDYEETSLGSGSINRSDAQYTQYNFAFNASGQTRVQGWFGSPNTNYGILWTCSANNSLYGTGENATESYRPVLTVTYTASGIAIPVAQYYYNRLRRN